MRRAPIFALLLMTAGGTVAAACGSSTPTPAASHGSNASTTTAPPTTAAPAPTTTSPSSIATIPMPSPAGKWGTEPTVTVPNGAPPTVLEASNLITGTGATAQAHDTVTVQYVGVDYDTQKEFQASWDSGMPFSFTLGVGQVIPGWDQGVVGMKVGGRRELVIPPALAYGATPPPNSGIAPNATLIFVIDLLKVAPPSSSTS